MRVGLVGVVGGLARGYSAGRMADVRERVFRVTVPSVRTPFRAGPMWLWIHVSCLVNCVD